MSYCVNCGVKLKPSEDICPLCGTPVVNPNAPKETAVPAYPEKVEKIMHINFKNLSKLIVDFLLIIAAVSILCDLIMSHSLSWSRYVFFALIYLCCQVTFIINKNVYLSLAIDLLATEFLLFSFSLLSGYTRWFTSLAMPLAAAFWVYVTVCTMLFRRKGRNNMRAASICLFLISLFHIFLDILIHCYQSGAVAISWALYASLPIAIVSVIFFISSFSHRLLDEIKQRIFL